MTHRPDGHNRLRGDWMEIRKVENRVSKRARKQLSPVLLFVASERARRDVSPRGERRLVRRISGIADAACNFNPRSLEVYPRPPQRESPAFDGRRNFPRLNWRVADSHGRLEFLFAHFFFFCNLATVTWTIAGKR